MKQFVSPHVHVQSLDSASTPKLFAKRETELGTGFLTVTDHGTLEATRAAYDLCAKGGAYHGKLSPILGVEAYFRDDNDPILKARGIEPVANSEGILTYQDYYKYAHITLHALDEPGYMALVKKLSDADLRAERHGSERKPLFDWNTLEELGQHNITATSGCLIGMVGRHLLKNNDVKTAIAFYEKTRASFKPGNFYVEIFPHVCDRFFQASVTVELEDGSRQEFKPYRKLLTQHGETKAEDLARDFARDIRNARVKHVSILDVMEDRKWTGKQALGLKNVVAREDMIMNECRSWCNHSDYQLEVNRFLAGLAKKYNDPLLISDDSHFAYPDEKVIQDIRLGGNWRFANSHHRMTSEEAFGYFKDKFGMSEGRFEELIENSHAWANRFKDFKFNSKPELPTKFYPDDTLRHTFTLIQKHKRMDWNNKAMCDRLKQEIDLLHRNGVIDLLPYFFIDEEVCDLYRNKGFLTGPGRGSAAGVLLTFLLGITHYNPLDHDLSLDRFLTKDRVQNGKYPDIDQDLPFRDLLVHPEDPSQGFLAERFGPNVAQMSVDVQIKPKMAIKDTHRAMDGYVSDEVEAIAKALPNPPQGVEVKDYVFGYEVDGTYYPGLVEVSDTLKMYMEKYPKHWAVASRLVGTPKTKGRHPCGFIISNKAIDTFIPMTTVGGVRVTAFTAASAEAAGALKMDFLTVNSVGDVDRAVRLIQKRHAPELLPDGKKAKHVSSETGLIYDVQALPLNGKVYDIYGLPNDKGVFTDICKGKVETVFQLDGGAARAGLREFAVLPDGSTPLKSLEDLSAFTALDRPGPLDAKVTDGTVTRNMLQEFAVRARGEAGIGRMEVLDKALPKTNGVIVYQEQLQTLFAQIGKTSGTDADKFRQRIGKKKITEVRKTDKPLFMKGAVETLGQEEADRLWGMMETFGQYGFNKSHSLCYMGTAYACAFLKHHYPLEWWTSVLSNADRADVRKFWRWCGPMILNPDLTKTASEFVIEGDKIRAPVWLIDGIGENAHKLMNALTKEPLVDLEDFLTRIRKHREANSTQYTKTVKGEQVQATRLGHNPLNSKIMTKMILCGVLDGLFPAERDGLPLDIVDKLSMYASTEAKVNGKKKAKPIATPFTGLDRIQQCQLIKSIMPSYNLPLVDMFVQMAASMFNTTKNRDTGETMVYYVSPKGDNYRLIGGEQFAWLEDLEAMPEMHQQVAVPVYVIEHKKFTYAKDGQARTAVKIVVDIEGHQREFVKWPNKAGIIPANFSKSNAGAFAVLLLSRRNTSEPFFLQDMEEIAAPLKEEKEEESNE